MAKGINIDFVADVSRFLSGTRNVSQALDDVVDALDDVGSEGKDSARDAERGLSDVQDAAKDAAREVDRLPDKLDDVGSATKDAGDTADKLERKFSDAFDKVRTDAKTTGSDIGTHMHEGSERAQEGFDEIKDSARSNATETAASFDGSFDSISDGVQGTVAEFLQGFGPAGTIAGLAVAGGIGLLKKAFDDQSAAAQQDAQDMADAYKAALDDMIESGENFVSQDLISQQIKAIVEDEDKLKNAQQIAAESGASLSSVLRGQAGDLDALGSVHDAYQKKIDDEQGAIDRIRSSLMDRTDLSNDQREALVEEIGQHQNLVDELSSEQKAVDDVREGYRKQASAADAYRKAVKPSVEQVRAAEQAERDFRSAVDDTTGTIKDNNENIKDNEDRVRANRSAINDLIDSGEGWVQNLRDANASSKDVAAAQRTVYDRVVAAGKAMGLSRSEAEDYADQLVDIPDDVKTKARLDLDHKAVQHAKDLLDSATKDRKVSVTVDSVDTRKLESVLRGRVFPVQVVARPGSPVAF